MELLLVRADTLGAPCRRSLVTLYASHGRINLFVFGLHLFVGEFLANHPFSQRTANHRTCNQTEGGRSHADRVCAIQPHAFQHTGKSACRAVAASHGDAAGCHANQRVNTHEAGDAHRHEVLHSNHHNQQGKHDGQKLAALLDDFKVALETNAGEERQHEDILQCAIERHLNIEPSVQRQRNQ